MSEQDDKQDPGPYMQMRTPYSYPDGDVIDLFVKADESGVGGTVTDMGETIRWLKGQTLSPRRTPRQTSLIADICATHGVEFSRGILLARYADDSALSDVALRVAQAALRVAELTNGRAA